MENSRTASLGCGTLILIALIVLIFGNASSDEIEQEVKQLRTDVKTLQQAFDKQTKILRQIEEKLDDDQKVEQN